MRSKSLIAFCAALLALQVSADELPPGVARMVNPDGSLYFIESTFTTEAYQNEALRLVIQEANKVAKEMNLSEALPISESTLAHAFIGPFGYNYLNKRLGNVTTENYFYGVAQNFKFSDLVKKDLDGHCIRYREKHQSPLSQLDTNSAYQLATQWLATLRIDVKALNAECEVQTDIDRHWNELKPGEEFTKTNATFVPIYYVSWLSTNQSEIIRSKAQVHLFLPTKTLLQLNVGDAKYILRQPLIFTNLAALFPGQATITTNWPSKPKNIIVSPSR